MTLAEVHDELSDHAAEVAKLFKPGAQVTIIIRNPSADKTPHSASMVITRDDLDEVIEALEYLKSREVRP